MEHRKKVDQSLNIVVHGDDGGGDPQPDGECPGLYGCNDYNPCPLKGSYAGAMDVSGALSREIARRVRGRLGVAS